MVIDLNADVGEGFGTDAALQVAHRPHAQARIAPGPPCHPAIVSINVLAVRVVQASEDLLGALGERLPVLLARQRKRQRPWYVGRREGWFEFLHQRARLARKEVRREFVEPRIVKPAAQSAEGL